MKYQLDVKDYKKRLHINSKELKSSSVEDKAHKERPMPFYNWLNEHDSYSEICSRPDIENWLEW